MTSREYFLAFVVMGLIRIRWWSVWLSFHVTLDYITRRVVEAVFRELVSFEHQQGKHLSSLSSVQLQQLGSFFPIQCHYVFLDLFKARNEYHITS